MTWFVYEDALRRLIPYIVKLKSGKLDSPDIAALNKPLELPK